ncbi:AprI/Inh family metalloprotease inhibitor [Tepidamorphus sp. 3E244]|uniref:AprI/Inh family metalloprotease inhibitor n=1 Tax=Tepidamorphus sp. 3E244 TaxID=3385498 RepID=UPI0038FC09C2
MREPFKTCAALVLAAATTLTFAGPSRADAARYTLAGADGVVVCALTLEPPAAGAQPGTDADGNPVPAPGTINAEADCQSRYTSLAELTGWVGGVDRAPLLFLNGAGEQVVEFQEIGDGIRVGRFPQGGIAYLALDPDSEDISATAPSTAPAEVVATGTGGLGIAGTWVFARDADGSDQLCTVRMSDDTGDADLPALEMQDGCMDNITVLDLAGWQIGERYLSVHDSAGQQRLTFSQREGPVWIRDPGGSRPLFLIRTGN